MLEQFLFPEPSYSVRSEEHKSELQSQSNLVCRLLLEKKKIKLNQHNPRSISHDRRHLVTYKEESTKKLCMYRELIYHCIRTSISMRMTVAISHYMTA